jgi:hypothetical protein
MDRFTTQGRIVTGMQLNHNETLLPRPALAGTSLNHNETLLRR